MSHDFYCGNCNRWVANCGFSDNSHTQTFSFSTTCACGKSASGSCGGRSIMQSDENRESLFRVECEDCKAVLSYLLKSNSGEKFSVDITCPNCKSKKIKLNRV
ncbi:MAG: hypothetical protein PHN88_15340 [Ignavibacteria bacterium]|nr:hypothetical protein [Ignavibacteria bacterium]